MLLLDTNVFNNRKFLDWLKGTKKEVSTSSISVMELAYHHFKKGMPEGYTLAVLTAISIGIADFDYKAAVEAAKSAVGKWDFSEKAADYAILGTAKKLDATIVTENKEHFAPYSKVKTPRELMGGE